MMNRRAFFGALLGAAAIAADPERLLFVPGKKLYTFGRPRIYTAGDLIAEAMQSLQLMPPPTPEDIAYALDRLNHMLDDWPKEPLIIHRIPDPFFYPDCFTFTQTMSKEEFRRRYPDKALR
jgi:hypothetical protein